MNKSQSGFTILELVIVVICIVILVGITLIIANP